jgi:dihydroxyacetone kinase-like predicted kinase
MKRTPNGSSGTPVAQFGEKGGSPSGLVRPGADPGRAASLVSRPMSTVTSLTPADLRALISGYADALADHRETINRLNVYPVPDGDTGTNMALTLSSVVAELDGATHDLDATCHAISHGSLMGARGNSGVILSQILRGLAGVMREAPEIDGATVADALDAAATAP